MGRASWGPWPGKTGGGGGDIEEVTSVDGSVTITDPTGPTVDLSVKRPVILLALSDLAPQGEGTNPITIFMANRGSENGVTNQVDPVAFPIGLAPETTMIALRACVPQGCNQDITFTVFLNGVATPMTTTIPGGSPARTIKSDNAHTVVVNPATDVVDVAVSYIQPLIADLAISASIIGF